MTISRKFIYLSAFIGMSAIANIALADTMSGASSINGVVIAPPAAMPPAGTYASYQNVTLNAPGSSDIYYTADGTTTPTCSTGTAYSGAVTVSSSLVIEAVSCYPNSESSTVASYKYVIIQPLTVSAGMSSGSVTNSAAIVALANNPSSIAIAAAIVSNNLLTTGRTQTADNAIATSLTPVLPIKAQEALAITQPNSQLAAVGAAGTQAILKEACVALAVVIVGGGLSILLRKAS